MMPVTVYVCLLLLGATKNFRLVDAHVSIRFTDQTKLNEVAEDSK